jgi:hypothetical protein
LELKVGNLVDDFFAAVVDKTSALAEFAPTASGTKTCWDEFVRIRSIIGIDGVLAEDEIRLTIENLLSVVLAAKTAISSNDKSVFTDIYSKVKAGITFKASAEIAAEVKQIVTFARRVQR